MRTVKLKVSLSFADKLKTNEEIQNVIQNVFDTLTHEVNHGIGLAPDNTETYTTKIEVADYVKTKLVKTFK